VVRASREVPPAASTPSPCGVAGLGALPSPGVAWAAVPDAGTGPFRRDRPAGCHATGCGPDPPPPAPPLDDHGQTTPGTGTHAPVHDQQERDTSCRGAGQVPIPLITPQVPWVAGGEDGTTAGRVARNRGGLVGNGRAPASGTAARATT
jgi:hypothetical protein